MLTALIWWFVILIIGLGFMPITGVFFGHFRDKGWLFSKVLGIFLVGFTLWYPASLDLIDFTGPAALVITLAWLGISLAYFLRRDRQGKIGRQDLLLVLAEEFLFFLLFMVWIWLVAFRPEVFGTEKFMDYGFMASMMRSTELPAPDIWYSGKEINYYYGGQYFAVFLTKLTGTHIKESYNVMRALVAALAFVLPFALIRQVWEDREFGRTGDLHKKAAGAGILPGLLAAGAVSFAGNMHYVLAAWFLKPFYAFLGHDKNYKYWFPDSTRYIGYFPEGKDKTIHEFPSYSFILGDLHAHVVNLIFVLLLLGFVYAVMQKIAKQEFCTGMLCRDKGKNLGQRFRDWLLEPHMLLLGLLLGLFHLTNFWDFIIYLVLVLILICYEKMIVWNFQIRQCIPAIVFRSVYLYGVSWLAALPFTLSFETMVEGIGISKYHTAFHQFLVVWGLPILLSVLFIVTLSLRSWKIKKEGSWLCSLLTKMGEADLYILILSACGLGLLMIPELVYVKDIYENGFSRANTMFKLTYQAFTMLGMSMAYIVFSFLTEKKPGAKIVGAVCGVLLLMSTTYVFYAGHAWFGNVFKAEDFQGIDGTAFLKKDFPGDEKAIAWINHNIKGSPVMLEAQGDSYSKKERVSAMTGLPTVLGWYVHEWLWRGNVEELNQRKRAVEQIYTSDDEEKVRQFLDYYKVDYIYVGDQERESYPSINEAVLKKMGKVVFSEKDTYIIAIDFRF